MKGASYLICGNALYFAGEAAGIPPLGDSFFILVDIITMAKLSQPLLDPIRIQFSILHTSLQRVIEASSKSICWLARDSTRLDKCNDYSPCFRKVGPVWRYCCYEFP
jgi:hypothetical protein